MKSQDVRVEAYLDNVVVSGKIRSDLPASEMQAVSLLFDMKKASSIILVTSRESWREQERATDPAIRAALEAGRGDPPIVGIDYRLERISFVQDPYRGFINSSVFSEIVDQSLFANLKAAGLKDADARHLMYAAVNSCNYFLTLDPDFLTRRADLERLCPGVLIGRPTELLAELSPPPHEDA